MSQEGDDIIIDCELPAVRIMGLGNYLPTGVHGKTICIAMVEETDMAEKERVRKR